MHTATVDPLVGRLLEGRYRILDRIARGGMSTVYTALDQRLDRRVAVKIMSSALSADPKFTDRFAREARAAARLSHVNAVSVYDQGVDEAHGRRDVFLVMELVEGRTLRDLIRERGGRFSPAEAVSIMEPVLSALSAAHRAGLVHRDIKPENILLSDDGLVKVADFGLARAIDADAASTRTGLMMGTVAYCAPEQIVHGRCDQRSDVYSAGIVLFELLTGRPPFQGDSAMNVAYQHVHSRVPAPSSRARGIPTPIDEIVVAVTDSDPNGRPADASAFLAELADTRAALALPIVPIPPRRRERPAPSSAAPRTAPMRSEPMRSGPAGSTDVIGPRPGVPAHGPAGNHADLQNTQVVQRRPHQQAPHQPVPQQSRPLPPVGGPPPRAPKRGRKQRPPLSPRARRRRRRLIVLIVFLVLGILSVTAGIVGVHLFREWNSHVPKVGGLQRAEATAALRSAGYAVDTDFTSQWSETVAKGAVITTDPSGGTRLAQGKSIRLVLSLGKLRIKVPDIRNKPVGAAETSLQDKGLTFDPTTTMRTSTTVPSGTVITTNPAPGTPVKKNTQVVLIVSSGLPQVAVPDIAPGTSYDDAAKTLQNAHFKVARVDDFNDTVAPGDVISSAPGGKQQYGSTITVHVSKGPQFVTVPDYTPLSTSASDYEQQLVNLGLNPDVRSLLGGEHGVVVSVKPGPGTQLHPGDAVTVNVV